jgi:fructose-specific phosphotransferase system IIC component
MYGALVACVLAVVIAGGMVAIGNTSARPHVAERGKVTLIWSLLGAVIVGVAIPLVNKAFSLS